jgi:hypothetical protein
MRQVGQRWAATSSVKVLPQVLHVLVGIAIIVGDSLAIGREKFHRDGELSTRCR